MPFRDWEQSRCLAWTNRHDLEVFIYHVMFGSVQLLCYAQLLCVKSFPTHPGLCFCETPPVNHQPGSCRLWFSASRGMRDSETLFSFPRRALKPSHCRVFSTRKWYILQNKEEARCFSPRMRALTGSQPAGCWPAPRKESHFSYKSNDWKPSLKKTLQACKGMIPLVLPTSNPFKKSKTLSIAHLLAFLPHQGTVKPTGGVPSQAFWNPAEMSREQWHPTSSRTVLIPALVAEAPGPLVLGAHYISGWLLPGAHTDCCLGRCSCLRLRVWFLQSKTFQQSSVSVFPDTFH